MRQIFWQSPGVCDPGTGYVLSGEVSGAEAAGRHGVSDMSVSKWKQQFLDTDRQRLEEQPSGPAGHRGTVEKRRLCSEKEQLKLALAEATVQLRTWRHGAKLVDQVPSQPSNP